MITFALPFLQKADGKHVGCLVPFLWSQKSWNSSSFWPVYSLYFITEISETGQKLGSLVWDQRQERLSRGFSYSSSELSSIQHTAILLVDKYTECQIPSNLIYVRRLQRWGDLRQVQLWRAGFPELRTGLALGVGKLGDHSGCQVEWGGVGAPGLLSSMKRGGKANHHGSV